jgi:hypothetical protein
LIRGATRTPIADRLLVS